jgi:multiple sugar transport system substrate-binding protein
MGGAAFAFAAGVPAIASAEELTIFWAEWDPANQLQELANLYTAETGVTVTVQTTPWGDFQTKAFAEFNAKGDAYDMIVGDSQWLGASSKAGHYVDLTDFVKKNKVLELMAPATMKYYSEYPGNSGKYWSIPAEGDAVGWAYRKDLLEDPTEMANFKAKYGYDLGVPKDFKALRDIAEFFYRPDKKMYGIAIYTQTDYDGLAMGFENALFSYGGEMGDYATYQADGIINSAKAVEALEAYKELYKFTPPNWSNAFFQENNQALTEGLVPITMNYFAFLPSLLNESTNKYAKVTGFFANPPGPYGDQYAALGGQGISIVSYSKKQAESFKFLEWFIKDETQQKWADLGGYTCSAAVLSSEAFRKKTPYNEAFYQTMFKVKDFWAVPEFADMLIALNQRVSNYVQSDKGTAKEALDGLASDWEAIFKKAGYK